MHFVPVCHLIYLQVLVEFGAFGTWYAMVWPKGLVELGRTREFHYV